MTKTYSFDLSVGCLYWGSFEKNLKKAILHDHVEDYVMTKGFLVREYNIKGASENFVDYVRKFVDAANK